MEQVYRRQRSARSVLRDSSNSSSIPWARRSTCPRRSTLSRVGSARSFPATGRSFQLRAWGSRWGRSGCAATTGWSSALFRHRRSRQSARSRSPRPTRRSSFVISVQPIDAQAYRQALKANLASQRDGEVSGAEPGHCMQRVVPPGAFDAGDSDEQRRTGAVRDCAGAGDVQLRIVIIAARFCRRRRGRRRPPARRSAERAARRWSTRARDASLRCSAWSRTAGPLRPTGEAGPGRRGAGPARQARTDDRGRRGCPKGKGSRTNIRSASHAGPRTTPESGPTPDQSRGTIVARLLIATLDPTPTHSAGEPRQWMWWSAPIETATAPV